MVGPEGMSWAALLASRSHSACSSFLLLPSHPVHQANAFPDGAFLRPVDEGISFDIEGTTVLQLFPLSRDPVCLANVLIFD